MLSYLLYRKEEDGFLEAGAVVCPGTTTGIAFPFSEQLSWFRLG